MDLMELTERIICFIIGLFFMALGIAFAINAGLGITPVSCPPYALSFAVPLTIGQLTIGMHITMIIAQVIILRKDFKKIQYFQILVSFLFGFFVDAALWITQSLEPVSYFMRIAFVFISSFLVAAGIVLVVASKTMLTAGEGLMLAIAKTIKRPFGQIKVALDCFLVLFSVISSLILYNEMKGVREGTLIAAVTIGLLVSKLNMSLGVKASGFLARRHKKEAVHTAYNIVTIGRELGSGGREIGLKLAEKTGWKFIYRELVNESVKAAGLSDKYVETHEQQMTASDKLLRYISMDNLFSDEKLSNDDKLFITQSKLIRRFAEEGDCVIVGRCGDVILQDNPNCFNVFVSADKDFAKKRVAEEFSMTYEEAEKEIERVNKLRGNHYRYYTGKAWGDPSRYDMYIKSSDIGIDKAVEEIYNVIKK